MRDRVHEEAVDAHRERSDAPSASESGTSTRGAQRHRAQIGCGHDDQLVQHPRRQRDRGRDHHAPRRPLEARPFLHRFAARHRATYPTRPTTASTAATTRTGATPTSGRSSTRRHGDDGARRVARPRPTAVAAACRAHRRAVRARGAARRPGSSATRDAAHAGAEVADGVGGDVASGERGTEQRGGADDRGQRHDLGERLAGRCTATNTAASAHAPTSTTLSTRPGPSGTRSPTNAAITASASATTASTIDAVARDVHGGRSRTSSRMLASSRGWTSSRLVATVTPIVERLRGACGRRGAAGKAATRFTDSTAADHEQDDTERRARSASAETPELVGDTSPHERAREQTERDADHEPDRRHGARLPRHGGPDLPTR